MWIHDKNGFFSVVALDSSPDHVLVRARVKNDLARFCRVLGVPESAIVHLRDADYAWRAGLSREITRDALHDYFATTISELDYTSHCKEEMTNMHDGLDAARYRWYLDTWTGGLKFQQAAITLESRGMLVDPHNSEQ